MRFIKKILSIIIFPILLIQPQVKNKIRDHDFSGNAVLSLTGIFNLSNTDYSKGKVGFGAVGMMEYFIPTHLPTIFGLRFLFGGQSIGGTGKIANPNEFMTDMYILGGGLTLGYTFDNQFFPYIFGGVSNIWFSPKDKNGKRLLNNSLGAYSRSTISYDAEIGSRIELQKRLSLFLGASVHFVQTDNLDDLSIGSANDLYYAGRIGVSISFFGKVDSDGDGIDDSEDACPSNQEDYDGLQDDDGCPDLDNDADGILDVKDKCPNDPEDKDRFQDEDGCPDYDNDNDGIPDSLDKCPNAPENYNGFEDKDGCPDVLSSLNKLLDSSSLDKDKDEIIDSLDKCPDVAETYNGFQDDDGCPDTINVSDTLSISQIVLEAINLFEWRSSEIKPTAFEVLDKTAEFLLEDPFIKWAVESYTDNYGDSDSLKILSQERAKALVRYWINKGLPSFMFKFFGKGSESPIADNSTLEGRIKNNRIVVRRIE